MQQLLLWFFHIIAVFWTIKFPFHAKSFENKGYTRFVHFGMIALTFIVPSISVAVVFGTGGCRTARIPAIICLARETNATFYAFVLPLSIVTAAGISLIVYMFWILYHITRDLSHIQKQKQEEEKGVCNLIITTCIILLKQYWLFTIDSGCLYIIESFCIKNILALEMILV